MALQPPSSPGFSSGGMPGAPQQPQQPGQQPKRRRCAEVCYELLALEALRYFASRQEGPSAPAAMEAVGFRVGRQLAERYTRDKPRLGDTLEVIKFVCKDFWQLLFKKQVDNLRTNHRGVYVLQDNGFRWTQRLAPLGGGPADPARDEAAKRAALSQLSLPCGIIRGALCHLGVVCTVEADIKTLPACAFTVKIST